MVLTRALAALAVLGLLCGAAGAQTFCGKRDAIVDKLEKKYGETRRSFGIQQGRGVVEVWSSERTGTWTILLTNAKGLACLIAAGEAFEEEAAKGADG